MEEYMARTYSMEQVFDKIWGRAFQELSNLG